MTDLTPEEALAAALHRAGTCSGWQPDDPDDHARDHASDAAATLAALQGFAIVRSDELAGLRAALTTIRDGYVYAVGECLWCMASIHAETDHKADCPVTIARSALEGVSR